MRSILAMAGKDLILLLRDKAGFFFVFFFPLIYAVFFGAIFSGSGNSGMSALEVAVVDEDQTETSQKFIKRLDDASEISVLTTDREQAHSLVKKGNRTAYIVIPKGFEDNTLRLLQGESLSIEVNVDASRNAEAGLLQGVLTQYAFQTLQDLFMDRSALRKQVSQVRENLVTDEGVDGFTRAVLDRFFGSLDTFLEELPEQESDAAEGTATSDSGGSPLANWQPIRIDFQKVGRESTTFKPKTSYDITMPQAFVWVFLGCAAAFGISLVTERTRGTLMRLRSAPISLSQILAGKALACFVTIMTALIVLLIFFTLVFGVRPCSYPNLALAFVSATLAFVGIMMLISVLGKTEASAGGVGWAFLLVMAMTGGGMVPLMVLPSWMKTLSHFSFVKWAVVAVEGAVWRGFTLQEMLLPCGILIGIGVVAFSLGVGVFRATAE